MRVLFLAGEVAPYAKAGGLGDVAAALPPALRRLGHEVRVVMPRYGSIDPDRWNLRPVLESVRFPAGYEKITASLYETDGDGAPVQFIEIPWLFGERHSMYDQDDDPRRFVLFTAAALAAQERTGWAPDVIHANDWHTAIAPAMLRGGRAGMFYVDTASVLTVHNLAYQGWTERGALDGAAAFLPHWVTERWVNILATGLTTADLLTTVSPTYAREILTHEYGEKLEGLLHSRRDRLHGVLNGLDTERFDPTHDPAIPAHYSAENLAGKAVCKEALQREAGFAPEPGVPLLAMVSRLVDQKGFDLFAGAVQGLLHDTDLQVVVLGHGQAQYHALLQELQYRHPDRIRAWITFDPALAQRIYAGADLFLMPSRFEPCGLGQMIAMRYGAVPIVRGTGGLADTVHEGPPGEPRTGFVFWEYTSGSLLSAVRRALAAYDRPAEWRTLQENDMRQDFSWDRAARTYGDLYTEAVRRLRG